MKTQYKIALFLIVANTFMLIVFGASVYYFLYNYSYTDFYKRLGTRASITAKYNFDTNNKNAESIRIIREQHLEKLSNEKEHISLINSFNDLKLFAEKASLPLSFIKEIYINGKGNLQIENTFYSGTKYKAGNKVYLVIISAENYYATHHLALLKNIIIVGLFFIIFITISLSFYFSKHIFDPIRNITDKVKKISTDNIHLRLEESEKDNEISQLILTFNNLFNRLETAFETQKNFISNASHEFGTPLTSIIGEADVALMKERTPKEYQETLQSILSQAERLNQISQSLLFLAQTGYRENRLNFEIIRTDEIIWQAKEIIDKLIPKNKIQIDFSLLPENPFKLKVSGNKQLLTLAFVNVLTNACKYSNNKTVLVSIASSNHQVIIEIKDQGIGIPESELQFIYDPFFRASNTHQFEGYGIGLPLTRNIIKIHNGQLLVSSVVNKGTSVQIKIPLTQYDGNGVKF